MNAPSSSDPFVGTSRPWSIALAASVLVLGALLAWLNSFGGPFVLDDLGNIAENPSLRRLTAPIQILSPPAGIGVGGRPLLNLSFALNYAAGGLNVGGYHAANLALHILAGLTLFGLLRRTLLTPTLELRFGGVALPFALMTALLWTLHPVQTQSVTYISQRAEVQMGLLYLLTLYCFVRSSAAADPGRWQILSVIACTLGMMTKEIMVTAPVVLLLYDRTFVAGTFRDAVISRPRFYVALAATWLVLGFLMTDVAARGIGTGHDVTGQTYLLTEFRAVVYYLRLGLWPQSPVFDHGPDFLRTFSSAAPYALVVLPLLAGTVIALVRWPVLGFVAAWFFVILAPTSSFVPVAFSPIAENRLYLPLVSVTVFVALALQVFATRRALGIALALAVASGLLVARRNFDFQSDVRLWADTVAKRPENAGARYNFGLMLSRERRVPEAIAQWEIALRLEPNHLGAHNNLANALALEGRAAEAVPHYEAALRQQPTAPVIRANLALVLLSLGRVVEAETQARLAVAQGPKSALAQQNLGLVLQQAGQAAGEIAAYETALRLEPEFADAHHNLGLALVRAGRTAEAIAHFETEARLRPGAIEPPLNIIRALLTGGRHAEARTRAETLLRQFPRSPDAHLLLGNALAVLGKLPDACNEFERALELQPDFSAALMNLVRVLISAQSFAAAQPRAELLVAQLPRSADAQLLLGKTLALQGKFAAAIPSLETALRLQPDLPGARQLLESVRTQARGTGAAK